MDFQTLIFYAYSAILIGGAIFVIIAQDMGKAALTATIAIASAAGLSMLMDPEFLAIALIPPGIAVAILSLKYYPGSPFEPVAVAERGRKRRRIERT